MPRPEIIGVSASGDNRRSLPGSHRKCDNRRFTDPADAPFMIQPDALRPLRLQAYQLAYPNDPLRYFSRLRGLPGAVLLDSGAPSTEAGRFDVFSALPVAELTTDAWGIARCPRFPRLPLEPFEAQRALLGLLEVEHSTVPKHLPFSVGLIGCWLYEFGRLIEGLPGRPPREQDGPLARLPAARVGLYDWSVIQDHQRRECWLIADERRRSELVTLLHADAPAPRAFALEKDFSPTMSRDEYAAAFTQVQRYIENGDCYQINLTQRFCAPYRGDEWEAYLRLRRATPSPFGAFLSWTGEHPVSVMSASPERFLRLEHGVVTAQPIKGTRPRGATAKEDERQARALEASLKDLAENVMIVDLLRNDLGRVSQPGSIAVPTLAKRIAYANVHHLVSTVTGRLMPEHDAHELLRAAFPGGSITGAPKHRAMEIIDELERSPRTFYCGSVGYIDVGGDMDTSIAIRTAVAVEGELHLWGGGGIVADSDQAEEYAESIGKIARLMEALSAAE